MPAIVLGLGCDRVQDRHSHVSIIGTTGMDLFTFLCHLPLFTCRVQDEPLNVGKLTHPLPWMGLVLDSPPLSYQDRE